MAKQELLATIRDRYRASSKREKSLILDEFIAVTGHHRKHGIRLLGHRRYGEKLPVKGIRRRERSGSWYGKLLTVCGKRLKALTWWSPWARPPGSGPAGAHHRGRHQTQEAAAGPQFPVRTFADWHSPPTGFLEIDLVVHHGGSLLGFHDPQALHRLLLARDLVVAYWRIGRIALRLDSDFWLTQYCAERGIVLAVPRTTRPGLSRRTGRWSATTSVMTGSVAGQTMAHLYGAVRQYVNYFQPSLKLVEKTRHGSRVVKRYSPPATPCDRLMQHDAVSVEMKAALSEYRVKLDPVALLHAIREAQSALAAVTSPEIRPTPSGESLEQFLAKLPDLWRQDAAHGHGSGGCNRPAPGELGQILSKECGACWTEDPDASAVVLLGRQQEAEPDRFSRAHLRTLNAGCKWRGIMSKELVYAAAGEPMAGLPAMPELALVGADPKC